jgi:vacuolar-type H+-ATPase subunit H
VELERLIETERRNEDLLQGARDEARTIVEAARKAAQDRAAALSGELEADARRSEAALGAERERRIVEIRETARDRASRYESVPEERVLAVGRALVDRLLAGDDS